MEKKLYEQPEVEVVNLVSEQPVFTGSGSLEDPTQSQDVVPWL